MKKLILLLLGLIFCASNFAQKITIVDQVTQEEIPNVTIYSKNSKVKILSSLKGDFDLQKFNPSDSIYFKYTNYELLGIKYSDLIGKSTIELRQDPLSLNDVIVTANRWEQNKRNVPFRIEKLNLKDVSFLNPQTTADLLENSGYAFVQKSQLAGGSPQLRGFGTNRVMIVIDGVRMNNAIYRSGNLQNVISLDANSLEGAEILFGPGAVMYGSDAIGGVMDFRTKEAKFSNSNENQVSGNIFARHSTANTEWTKHVNFNFANKRWALLTDVTFSDFGDLRTGSKGGDSSYLRLKYQASSGGKDSTFINEDPHLQVNSAYSQRNVIQKIKFKVNETLNFEYALNYTESSNAPRYDRLTIDLNNDGNLDNAEWYYGPQKWIMNRFAVNHSKSTKLYDKLRFIASFQNYEESRHDRRFNNLRRRSQIENVGIFSLNSDLNKKISEKLDLSYGAEFVSNSISSEGKRVNIVTLEEEKINSRYPNNSKWNSAGVYSNLRYKIYEKFILNTGLRFSYYALEANFDTTLFPYPFTQAKNSNSSLNGSIGLVYNPKNNLQFYTNGSTGFRAPNIDDIGKVFDSQAGALVVPNADLKPEYAYNGELGFISNIKNNVKIDGVFYYTYLQNALARSSFQINGQDSMLYDDVMSKILAIQNTSNAIVYGVQAGIEVNIYKGLSLKSVISLQEGKEYSVDSLKYFPKPHVAPIFGRTTLSFKHRKFRSDFFVAYNGKMDMKDFPLTDLQDNAIFAKDENGNPFTPAWYTLNFKIAYYPNKNMSVAAGIENITDQLYRSFASGISASGRNFTLTLRANF
jgi:hemoglobin/transferrin/lactoferrin receptor protein